VTEGSVDEVKRNACIIVSVIPVRVFQL